MSKKNRELPKLHTVKEKEKDSCDSSNQSCPCRLNWIWKMEMRPASRRNHNKYQYIWTFLSWLMNSTRFLSWKSIIVSKDVTTFDKRWPQWKLCQLRAVGNSKCLFWSWTFFDFYCLLLPSRRAIRYWFHTKDNFNSRGLASQKRI